MGKGKLYLPGTRFSFEKDAEGIYIPKDRGVFVYRFGKVQVEARVLRTARNTIVIESRRAGECIWKRSQAAFTKGSLNQQVRFMAGKRNNVL